ncbi:unnamed protein product [Phytomonas sp. Hart1]|nr:unnamed protein product [Phytomonas sp. Hart1]|eukprot:CCW70045.1 unnamed protein product [Phytomonas sp. isolate Hart1]
MPETSTFRDFLSDPSKILVLDGGLGTDLEVLTDETDHPLWSCNAIINSPDLITRLHESYLEAGAHCIITNSYQATTYGLAKYRNMSQEEAVKVIAKSVDVAHEARRRFLATHGEAAPIFVAGSVGSYGAYLADKSEYDGSYAHSVSVETFKDFHRPRIATLIKSGVDALAVETQPCADEVLAIVDLLEKEFPLIPAWISFTLNTKHLDTQIADGTKFEDILPVLDASNVVVAIGINCVPFHCVTSVLGKMSSLTTKPLIVYPNAPGAYDNATKSWVKPDVFNKLEDTLAGKCEAWIRNGARLIGGCCHTDKAAIQDLSHKLSNPFQ